MELSEFIQMGLENTKRGFDRALDGLTAAELKWQPRPDANPIGLIYFHCIRAEDSSIHLLQGQPQIWESGKWFQKFNKTLKDGGAHYSAAEVNNFADPDMRELLVYADAVRQNTLDYLKTLKKPQDYDRKIDMPPPPPMPAAPAGRPAPARPPFNPTVGSLLLRLLTHLSQHVGDISYIRGLERGMDQ